jgi:hypothetical protein
MNITDLLGQAGGFGAIARELGVSEDQAAQGAGALLPAVLGGLKKQAQTQPEGLGGLGDLLGQLGGGGLLDNVLAQEPTDVSQGNEVLGQIFGSKDVSRTVASHAASQSGLSPDLLKKMLPMVAMLAAGFMSRQAGASSAPAAASSGLGGLGGLGGMLGGLLGGGQPAAASGGGLGSLGGLGAMLDMNGDGNALDDVMRLAGKALR